MKNRKQTELSELNPENIHAVAIVGDSWVQTSIVDADSLGRVYFIAHHSQAIPTRRGCTPSLSKVTRALVQCWAQMPVTGGLDYHRFFLCLPDWVTSCATRTSKISIEHDKRIPCFRDPKVSASDIRRLIENASEKGLSPQQVAVEATPRYFMLSGGRRVPDPTKELSSEVTMTTDLVVAERGVVEALLDTLHEHGIKVDVVTSASSASYGCLDENERDAGTVVIHVGRTQSSLSCFDAGALRFTSQWGGGADGVLRAAASNLDADVRHVRSLAADRELLLFSSGSSEKISSLPLLRWSMTHPILRHLECAARDAVLLLADKVMHKLDAATQETSMNFERLVVMGDDPLTVRSLKETLEQSTGMRCRIALPQNVHISKGTARIFDQARSLGFIRRCVSPGQRHYCYLNRYNESAVDVVTRVVAVRTRDLSLRMIRRFADAVENRARDKQIGEMFPRTRQGLSSPLNTAPASNPKLGRRRMRLPSEKKTPSRLPIKMLLF
jgi:hypothetical protein